MNEEKRLAAMFAELNPPENDTAGAVLSRLHDIKRVQHRRLRPLVAVALAVLLLCGTAIALTVTGTVDLHPSDELINGATCLFRADWVPEQRLPISDELLAWMEPYLQTMPTEPQIDPDPDFPAYTLLDSAEVLAPLLENAGLYHSPMIGEATKTKLSILDDGNIKYASITQIFDQKGEVVRIGALGLTIVYGDGTEEPAKIAGLVAGSESGDIERGEYGTYDSPISGVLASYCFTHAEKEVGNDIVSMDVWVPDGAALWEFNINGGDADAQMSLMQELVDSLER